MNRYALKKAVFRLLGGAGLWAVTRWATRYSPRVFMYHRFGEVSDGKRLGAKDFEWQLRELSSCFNLMTFASLAEHIVSGRGVPSYSAVITVDDGYADFHHFAMPVLKKLGLPASIYVTSGFVDREIWLWPDQLEYVLGATRMRRLEIQLGGQRLDLMLETQSARKAAWQRIVPLLLSLSDGEMRASLLSLAHTLKVQIPHEAPDEYAALTWDQLRVAASLGIEVGPHTRTHPSLTRVSDEQLRSELAESKTRVEGQLGTKCLTFCYPNGTPDDVDERVKRAVQSAGFIAAAVAYFDHVQHRDPFETRRYPAGDSVYEFRKCTSGLRLLSGRTDSSTSAIGSYGT